MLRRQPLGGQGEALTWRGRVLCVPSIGAAAPRERRLRALALVGTAEQVAIGGAQLSSLIGELAACFDLPCQIEDDRPGDGPGHQQTIVLALERAAREAPLRLLAGAIWTTAGGRDAELHLTAPDGRPAAIVWLGLILESWVRSAFDRHGFEPASWPARSRERVFG
jgi:hypothetical protein